MIDKYVHVEMASYVYKGNQYHRCGTSQKRLLQLNFGISISCIMWWTHHYIWFLKWNQSTQFDAHGKDKKRENFMHMLCDIPYIFSWFILFIFVFETRFEYVLSKMIELCGCTNVWQASNNSKLLSLYSFIIWKGRCYMLYISRILFFLFGQTREYTLIIVICLDSSTIISDPYLYIYSLVNELICLHNVRKLGFFP